MLFDQQVVQARGSHAQARDFETLRQSLFLSCAQDIAKLCLDADKRTPSILNLISDLADIALRDELRDRYAIWQRPLVDDETDPEIVEALKRMEQREQSERRTQFDKHYKDVMAAWASLRDSKPLEGFSTVRDKVSAHTEVRFVADKYQLVDIGSLGIKWADLRSTIDSMQHLVEFLEFIVRNAGFAWDMLERQLSEAAAGFWDNSNRARQPDVQRGRPVSTASRPARASPVNLYVERQLCDKLTGGLRPLCDGRWRPEAAIPAGDKQSLVNGLELGVVYCAPTRAHFSPKKAIPGCSNPAPEKACPNTALFQTFSAQGPGASARRGRLSIRS